MTRYAAACLKAVSVIAGLGAVSFIYIFGHDLITQCDYFNARRIRVTGVHRLSASALLDRVGIHQGVNSLSVNLSVTRKRLLAHPWIAEAEVSRHLPDGIEIKIREHEPLAIVSLGRKFILNTAGEIFKEWKPSDPKNLPMVTGLRYSDINVAGEPRSLCFDSVIQFLTLARAPAGFLPDRLVKAVHVDREIGLTLCMSGNTPGRFRTVKLGYNDYRDKLKRLNAILIYLNNSRPVADFDTIDLNNIHRIVINPTGEKISAKSPKEA
jgi:cell division protein FtsQ